MTGAAEITRAPFLMGKSTMSSGLPFYNVSRNHR
jgi:hypothetical protein